MMTDIVERLRDPGWPPDSNIKLRGEAADEIEHIRAQCGILMQDNERLRAKTEWRPIETAPEDGTVVICALPGKRPFTAWFAVVADDFGVKDCWVCGTNWNNSVCEYELVAPDGLFWQPLPDAPEGE